jgi:hypothetical protein
MFIFVHMSWKVMHRRTCYDIKVAQVHCWQASFTEIIKSSAKTRVYNEQVERISMNKKLKGWQTERTCLGEQRYLVRVFPKAYMLEHMKNRKRNIGKHRYLFSFLRCLFSLILVRALEYRKLLQKYSKHWWWFIKQNGKIKSFNNAQ